MTKRAEVRIPVSMPVEAFRPWRMAPPALIANPPSALSDVDEAAFTAAREAMTNPVGGRDCFARADVPQGVLSSFDLQRSRIFPETRRSVRVYIPQQYDGADYANLIVFQDGGNYLTDAFNATVVLDNLIDAGRLQPTIAVFVEPGDIVGIDEGARANRSLEYDSLNDCYARLLLEEILPQALEGYRVTANAYGRVICGMGSGAIAAFTAAWHHPEAFGNVIGHCGSFTNIRGGGAYPTLVRTSPVRPIRVFLQSGANDMERVAGSWAIANHDMAAALRFMGYDYRFEFGNGGHSLHHGAAIFPQTLGWVWPEPALQRLAAE